MAGSGAPYGPIAVLLGRLMDLGAVSRARNMVLALCFSAAVGVFFGYYPARRAATLDPIDALRRA